MIVELNDENRQSEGLIEVMKRAAEICAEAEGIDVGDDVCEVSLSFVSPEEIREINRVYRSNDSVTDVLSFPQYADREEMNWEDYLCLGDVIICPERASEQAEEFGHSFEREMVYLMVHSVLHLLGYDHMSDDEKAVMRAKEEAVMDKVGLPRVAEVVKEPVPLTTPKELYKKALEATGSSYAPYSDFHVGAAVLTEDGTVYTGGNIENASYPVSLCAERTAMSKAVSEGHRKFKAIAIAAVKDGAEQAASPCGMCRQFIMEFGSDIDVIFVPKAGEDPVQVKISQLLTWGFSL